AETVVGQVHIAVAVEIDQVGPFAPLGDEWVGPVVAPPAGDAADHVAACPFHRLGRAPGPASIGLFQAGARLCLRHENAHHPGSPAVVRYLVRWTDRSYHEECRPCPCGLTIEIAAWRGPF